MKLKGLGFLLVTLSFFLPLSHSQSVQFSTVNVNKSSPLNKIFFDYKLVKIQYHQLKSAMSSRGNQHFIHLQGPDLDWNLEMYEHDIHSGDYVLRLGTDQGVKTLHRKPANTPMIGYLKSARGGEARLVVADNYIAGMVEQGGTTFFIEPANGIDPSLPADFLVIYNTDEIIQNTDINCGFDLYAKNLKLLHEEGKKIENASRNHCLQVEIAISNDFSVFQKRGSEAAVENWNTTVLTLMLANWDDEFQHGLEFVQSASFVALSPSSDPWNGINNIDAQLTEHRDWANSGGYGGSYDVATNWTTKYKTGAVGLAWVGVVCTGLRYNVCSDYGGSNGCLRQLQAHELGHNFGANHDGGGAPYIMAPAVNCTSAWSSSSVSTINNHVNSRGCLSICSGGSPPEADFDGTPTEKCLPNFVVQFSDLSTNDPTAWQWTFPGGTPSSSTAKNPSVTYKTYGMYDVILKASNPYGSHTINKKQFIFVKDKPVATFLKVVIGRFVYLTNTSIYATSVEWDFGDGEISNDENPVHEYAEDGVYDIVLRAENDCGFHEVLMTATIVTIPVALFVADTTIGCTSMKVKYTNLSTKNVTSWNWDFPGGTPSTSKLFEPTVEYKNPGTFDVRLEAKNSKYKAVAEKLKYIHVDTIPIALFDTVVNSNVVNFTNQSKNAKSWLWEFGDGQTSTELNPSHSYQPGAYQAKLTVTNSCGTKTKIIQIVIGKSFVAGFTVAQQKGCTPYTVQFTNTSAGATSYSWSFPGGLPSFSTEQHPIITYNNYGFFDVTLSASNGVDNNTIVKNSFIEVQAQPKAFYQNVVQGFTVYLTNQSLFGTSYTWDFGDGTFSNDSSPTHLYLAEGEYDIKLISTNECGSDTFIKSVAIFLIPKVDFSSDTTVVCGSGFIQFISKTSLDVENWTWQFDGGQPSNSTEKNPKVFYNQKGVYSVKLAVNNSNGANELFKQSYIKVLSTVMCPEYKYFLTEDSGDIVRDPEKSYISTYPSIFPNPFDGKLTIQGITDSNYLQVRIVDLLGRDLFKEKFEVINGQYHEVLNLDHLNAGTYLINCYNTKDNHTKTVFLSK